MIERTIEKMLLDKVDFKKAIIILGPRQVGKTTIIKKIAKAIDSNYIYVNGDDPAVRLQWENASQSFINNFIQGQKVIVFDEAQRIINIGLSVKMILDANKGVQVFISGSSALEISSNINEPLTGRKWEYRLYPFSWVELTSHFTFAKTREKLEDYLVMGTYPDVINNPENSREILTNLAGSYLYKDVLELGNVRKPEVLLKLLQALAWQVGREVSYNELSQTVGVDKVTVSTYIDLLEKAFVVFKLHPYARNLRNEINTSRKIYFYDNGIRNSIINNYAVVSQRNDIGALWENFVISERKKVLAYSQFYGNTYFWRNTRKAEVDYLEVKDTQLKAYEIKWNPKKNIRFPKAFMEAYSPESTEVIHRDNFWELIPDIS